MLSPYASIFQTDLNPGERLLWTGQPRRGIFLRSGDVFLIPFSLVWGGFAIFWEVSVLVSGAPIFMALFGIPFVLIGLYMMVGRLLVDAYRRRSVYYAVTDQRILIYSGVSVRELKTLDLAVLPGVQLTEKRNGSGSILFIPSLPAPMVTLMSNFASSSGQQPLLGLDGIENVRMVYNLIQDAMRRVRDERS